MSENKISETGMRFFLPMKPPTATHQQKRVRCIKGKPVHYDSQEIKAIRGMFEAKLSKHAPGKPFEKGVKLTVIWIFETKSKNKDGCPKLTKPDTDNVEKLFKDCMAKVGFFKNDAQVFDERVVKMWGILPGIFVEIEEAE